MWELNHKEGWAPKNWCFWTVVLEKTLESPLDCKKIQSVNPKGNQSWIFIGRTDAEAPVLWSFVAKSQFIRKEPDAGKDWRQEEKGMTEDKMVGWHHWLNGHEFEQTPVDGYGQGSLACCSPLGFKESDKTVTEQQKAYLWLIGKRPWCWERLKVGGEGDDRGQDGWMTSLTQWTWIWVNSGSWWWTGKPGVLQSMVSQRVGHDWATELNWAELSIICLDTIWINIYVTICWRHMFSQVDYKH